MNLRDNSRNLPPIGQPKTRSVNARLEDLERKISRNFFEAAEALREIRDDKLYLVYAETFKEYCEKRLGRSISAVYEQLKMLEIHQEQKSKTSTVVDKPPLSEKDLAPVTGKFTSHQDKKYVADLRKNAREAKHPKKNDFSVEFTMTDKEVAEAYWDGVIARVMANKRNPGFVKALDEWLKASGL